MKFCIFGETVVQRKVNRKVYLVLMTSTTESAVHCLLPAVLDKNGAFRRLSGTNGFCSRCVHAGDSVLSVPQEYMLLYGCWLPVVAKLLKFSCCRMAVSPLFSAVFFGTSCMVTNLPKSVLTDPCISM